MTLNRIPGLFKKSFEQFLADNATRIGAALAYYSLFAIAPLLIIVISIVSLVFGEQAAQGQVVAQLKQQIGPQEAATVEQIINHTRAAHAGTWATVLGVIVAFVGATGFFVELQSSLDAIWKVAPKPGRPWLTILRDRLFSFILVLAIGLLLIALVVLTTILSTLSTLLPADAVPGQLHLWQALNSVISLVFLTVLFALVYKYLPDAQIAWRHVWVGSLVAAVLFTLGKYLIALYLSHSGVASAYGAAGSLVLVIVWVYYSAQIFLYGVEVTRAHVEMSGEPIIPAKNAQLVN